MESATQQQQQQQQRPPRTGVYVPRHRRVQNAGDDAQEPLSRSGTPNRQQESTQRPPSGRHNSSTSTFGSSSSQTKTWGSGGSTATETTTTTGTGGSGGNDWRACHQGSNHRKNFGSSSPASTTTPSSSSTSLSSLSNREGPVQPQPMRPPRGRNFDATVLNVYDDDRRPRYSRSNSSQYRRSNHSSGNSSPRDRPSTPESRSSRGVGIDAASWRSTEPSNISSSSTLKPVRKASGSVTPEVCSRSSSNNPSLDNPESAAAADRLAGQLQNLSVVDQGVSTSSKPATSSEGGGEEELEEWELAMQNSDEDAIPKLPTTGDDKRNKSGVNAKPSGTESPSSARTEAAAGDDAMGDDDYILELTHLAPSTKSFQVNDMFAPYANRSGGFRVKWIDDSRALVIFESATVAKQAYMATKSVTLATVAPYRGSDKDTIWRANRPSSTPSVRPAKTDSVARRLVHGALGIRERRTPEQIEQDRALRAAAREAREIARQERQRERQEMDAVFNQ
ncbi:R3H and coiled-coil domain-containing protein 1 [Actinomortierella wolfii]|nr:R3H and coiled-coil domain-containing protein 1 [Actinomortierella wolfii]